MSEDYLDVYKFIENIKDDIIKEVKINDYNATVDIDNCIVGIVENYLAKVDYLRDIGIIKELEINTYIYTEFKLNKDELIDNFLNKLAKEYLTNYLIDAYDINLL